LARSVERVDVGGAIGAQLECVCIAGDVVASNVVLIEEVVEAQADLGLVEAPTVAHGVVEEEVAEREGINGGLIVVSAIVLVESADAFVEDAEVKALMLPGNCFGFGVGRRVGDPQAGGRGEVELRR